MELLKNHRTIRSFTKQLIADDLLLDIIECGIRASNTGNMQLYSIIITKDELKKEQLSPLHFNQRMIKDAPVVLTICFDFYRFNRWCSINNTNTDLYNLLWVMNGVVDASILAQNICIAAESHSIGICYLGTTLYNAPEIIRVLDLPNGVIPVTTLTLGYPEGIPELTDRLPLRAIIHEEVYKDYSDEEIRLLYKEKEDLESSIKFVNENRKENLAQVYSEVRYKSSDSLFFSEKIKDLLLEQGFKL